MTTKEFNLGWRIVVSLVLSMVLTLTNHFFPLIAGPLLGGIICGLASIAIVPVKRA